MLWNNCKVSFVVSCDFLIFKYHILIFIICMHVTDEVDSLDKSTRVIL